MLIIASIITANVISKLIHSITFDTLSSTTSCTVLVTASNIEAAINLTPRFTVYHTRMVFSLLLALFLALFAHSTR